MTISDTGKLIIRMEEIQDHPVIHVIGIIDEEADFAPLLKTLQNLHNAGHLKSIQFDLGEITRMNSCGVREWILLMENIAPEIDRSFSNLKDFIVDQINMIPNMLGKGKVRVLSFQAPFFCDRCDLDTTVVFEPKQITFRSDAPVIPECKCPKCGNQMEFGSIEEEYFSFLRR